GDGGRRRRDDGEPRARRLPALRHRRPRRDHRHAPAAQRPQRADPRRRDRRPARAARAPRGRRRSGCGPGRAPARRHPDRDVGRPPPAHPARDAAGPAGGRCGAAPRGGNRPRMRLLLLTHYYAPEFGAPQRRWSASIGLSISSGHHVTLAAPLPHYLAGRPTRAQRRSHRVGAVERGRHGETVLLSACHPHRADITSRTADHVIAAADAMRRLRRRFSRPGTRPDVIVATAPAIPTLMVGRALSLLWEVPLVVEMRDAWPDLVTHVGPVGAMGPEALLAARRSAARRLLTWLVALVKGRVHREVTSW